MHHGPGRGRRLTLRRLGTIVMTVAGLVVLLVGIALAWHGIPAHASQSGRERALRLQQDASWVTASTVEVYVHKVYGREVSWYGVTRVRAYLPETDEWVELRDVNATAERLPDGHRTGWQTADSITGYEPPLDVRIADAGGPDVMARVDYEYWARKNAAASRRPWLDLTGLTVGGLVLVAVLGVRPRRPDPPHRR